MKVEGVLAYLLAETDIAVDEFQDFIAASVGQADDGAGEAGDAELLQGIRIAGPLAESGKLNVVGVPALFADRVAHFRDHCFRSRSRTSIGIQPSQ